MGVVREVNETVETRGGNGNGVIMAMVIIFIVIVTPAVDLVIIFVISYMMKVLLNSC